MNSQYYPGLPAFGVIDYQEDTAVFNIRISGKLSSTIRFDLGLLVDSYIGQLLDNGSSQICDTASVVGVKHLARKDPTSYLVLVADKQSSLELPLTLQRRTDLASSLQIRCSITSRS